MNDDECEKCDIYCNRCFAFIYEIIALRMEKTTGKLYLKCFGGLPSTLKSSLPCCPTCNIECFCRSCNYSLGIVLSTYNRNVNEFCSVFLNKKRITTRALVDR